MTALPLTDFDYEYPEELIASSAAEPRDSARLLVLDRAAGAVEHAVFRDLPGS
ncbi:MAG: S-adenosylmethionine:tRNA ribosyltransferase-isomerase [Elusimicrobiota bacterium]|nr:MAG: S-adenosylmethionine:tRNA ribosyltransferase-isomerase [Elusimicrobiota bacterium]